MGKCRVIVEDVCEVHLPPSEDIHQMLGMKLALEKVRKVLCL